MTPRRPGRAAPPRVFQREEIHFEPRLGSSRSMRKPLALLSFVLLAAPPRAAQTSTAPPPAAPAAAPAPRNVPPLQKAVEAAIQDVQAGKKDAAFAKLKEIEKDPAVIPPLPSLIGA